MMYSMKFDENFNFVPETLEDYSIILAENTDISKLYGLMKNMGFACTISAGIIRVYSKANNVSGAPVVRASIEDSLCGSIKITIYDEDGCFLSSTSMKSTANCYEYFCSQCKIWCEDNVSLTEFAEEVKKIQDRLNTKIKKYTIGVLAVLVHQFRNGIMSMKIVDHTSERLLFYIYVDGRLLKNAKFGLHESEGEEGALYQPYLLVDDYFELYYDDINDLLNSLYNGDMAKNVELSVYVGLDEV